MEPDQEIAVSSAELVEMLARCDAATAGPWRSFIEGRDHLGGDNFILTGIENQDIELLGASRADQDFIANARQDVPRLVAEVRHLKKIAEQA